MLTYDDLLEEARQQGIQVYEMPMLPRNKGLYMDGVVWVNKYTRTTVKKACILAEEIGHHNTSAGEILDQSKIDSRRQELRARQWAYEKLIPLPAIINAYKARVKGRHEIAEFLGVTAEFLQASIDRYTEKYGLWVKVNEQYTVCFDPLGVLETFSDEGGQAYPIK